MRALTPWVVVLGLLAGCRPAELARKPAAAPLASETRPESGEAEKQRDGEQLSPSPEELQDRAVALYTLGYEYELARNREKAVECYRRALALLPSQPRVLERLGLNLLRLGREAEGREALAQASALGAEGLELHQMLAQLYLRAGQGELAAREIEKVLASPRFGELSEKEPEASVRLYQQLLEFYRRAGKGEGVRSLYKLATLAHPGDREIQFDFLRAFLALKLTEDAEGVERKILALEPENLEVHRLFSAYYYEQKDMERALAESERYIAKAEQAEGDNSAAISMRYYRARLLEKLSRREEARSCYSEILERARKPSDRLDAYIGLADMLREEGERERAFALLAEARDQGVEHPRLYAFRGQLYEMEGAWGEAEADYLQAVQLAPEEPYYHYLLAGYYEKRGRRAAAIEELQLAVKSDPDEPHSANFLGYLWALEATNLEEAEKLIQRALQAEPRNGHFLDSLAWVHYQEFWVEEAYQELQRATELAPEEPEIMDHLGEAAYALGKLSEARAAWEKANALEKKGRYERKLRRLDALLQKRSGWRFWRHR